MLRKTDRYLKRRAKIWATLAGGARSKETITEIVRRETWWLLFVIPLYSRDTIIDKPR